MKITIEIPDTLEIASTVNDNGWLYIGQFIQGLGIRLAVARPEMHRQKEFTIVERGGRGDKNKILATLTVKHNK